ncbi:hypothetical protein [Saccharolobus islandicus]|uniref:hypothetical protein n=1 Tax=Saccharolobus islandicus TaxID=43080 RepID=UPI00064E48CB|nr:hypothetical protein [Sulfolobus islandicus]
MCHVYNSSIGVPAITSIYACPPSPPWYVQYASEIALAIFLASLGIAMYLSPKFRKAVIDLLLRLID